MSQKDKNSFDNFADLQQAISEKKGQVDKPEQNDGTPSGPKDFDTPVTDDLQSPLSVAGESGHDLPDSPGMRYIREVTARMEEELTRQTKAMSEEVTESMNKLVGDCQSGIEKISNVYKDEMYETLEKVRQASEKVMDFDEASEKIKSRLDELEATVEQMKKAEPPPAPPKPTKYQSIMAKIKHFGDSTSGVVMMVAGTAVIVQSVKTFREESKKP